MFDRILAALACEPEREGQKRMGGTRSNFSLQVSGQKSEPYPALKVLCFFEVFLHTVKGLELLRHSLL